MSILQQPILMAPASPDSLLAWEVLFITGAVILTGMFIRAGWYRAQRSMSPRRQCVAETCSGTINPP